MCGPLAAFSNRFLIITLLLNYYPCRLKETNIRTISLTCPFLYLLIILGNIKCSRPCTRVQLWIQVSVLPFCNCRTLSKSLKFSRLPVCHPWNWNSQSLPYWKLTHGTISSEKNTYLKTALTGDMAVIFVVIRSTTIPRCSHMCNPALSSLNVFSWFFETRCLNTPNLGWFGPAFKF